MRIEKRLIFFIKSEKNSATDEKERFFILEQREYKRLILPPSIQYILCFDMTSCKMKH